MASHAFIQGQIYHRRRDIHGVFGGQQYGGIATPSKAPFVFLFTGDAGEAFGYADDFQSDGMYWYTGEGQLGDMQVAKGNAAICHHQKNQKSLLLFEAASSAHVRFVGDMAYLGHHKEERPDRVNQAREAIVFHLELLPERLPEKDSAICANEPSPLYPPKGLKLEKLRKMALSSAPATASIAERLVNVRARSAAIKAYALLRAKGQCECCHNPAPFESRKGPFLEVHHVDRLADGGPDHPQKVIALCPNCHRKAHYAKNAQEFNNSLKDRLKEIEST